MSSRYSDYDPFARLYNRHWGPRSVAQIELIEEGVLSRVPAPARILDLCCGTGQFAHALGERGYDVLGVDGSEAMLSYARQNAPKAEFLLGDARTLVLAKPVDAVLCLYDSLNHLMTEAELGAAFQSVAGALEPGGVFAFDLNMEVKYQRTWAGEFSIVDEDQVALVRASVDSTRKRGLFDATLFYRREGDAWMRHDLRLVQTWYSEETVARLLGEAGFEPPTTCVKQALPDDASVAQNLLFVVALA